jgi:hypothetical protein
MTLPQTLPQLVERYGSGLGADPRRVGAINYVRLEQTDLISEDGECRFDALRIHALTIPNA